MKKYTKEQLYNDKLKATRKAVIGWVFAWTYIALLYMVFGPFAMKVVVSLAVGYDMALHFATALKNPYDRKWGWVFYPVIYQRWEDTRLFDHRYHLLWIPYWFTVLILVIFFL